MNLEAIRAKLKGLEEGKPKSKKWKPKDQHSVRCLPLPGEEDIAFVVKWHYGVDAGRPMACPSTWGDECAFCDLAKALKSWRDPVTGKDKSEDVRKKDWEFFKKVDAAIKYYIPVVVRKDGTTDVDGPFLWELTPKTYQTVLKICANDDWNDDHPEGGGLRVLTSLVHGLDLVVTLKKKGEKGNQTNFDITDVEERKKFSAVFKGDEAKAKALLERIPSISDITKVVTAEDAEKVFNAWKCSMSGDSSGSSDDAGTEYSGNNAEEVGTGTGSVDETVRKLESLISG